MTSIGLISCGKSKQTLQPGDTVPAKELYTSTYFNLKFSYVKRYCDERQILSAKHGLVDPETPLEVYDASLRPRDDTYIGNEEAAKWAEDVKVALATYLYEREPINNVTVLASSHYLPTSLREVLADYPTTFPFEEHEFSGNGEQMSWLKERIEEKNNQSKLEEHLPGF